MYIFQLFAFLPHYNIDDIYSHNWVWVNSVCFCCQHIQYGFSFLYLSHYLFEVGFLVFLLHFVLFRFLLFQVVPHRMCLLICKFFMDPPRDPLGSWKISTFNFSVLWLLEKWAYCPPIESPQETWTLLPTACVRDEMTFFAPLVWIFLVENEGESLSKNILAITLVINF